MFCLLFFLGQQLLWEVAEVGARGKCLYFIIQPMSHCHCGHQDHSVWGSSLNGTVLNCWRITCLWVANSLRARIVIHSLSVPYSPNIMICTNYLLQPNMNWKGSSHTISMYVPTTCVIHGGPPFLFRLYPVPGHSPPSPRISTIPETS